MIFPTKKVKELCKHIVVDEKILINCFHLLYNYLIFTLVFIDVTNFMFDYLVKFIN